MKKLICCCVVLLCFVIFSYAETIILNDGTTYTGNIPHQDDQVVYIIQKEALIKIPKKDIKEIKQDEEPKKKQDFLDINNDGPVIENSNEFLIKLGYDFYGKYKYKGHSTSENSPKGFNFSAEYYHYLQNIFGLGIGTTLQNSRVIGNTPGSFYFLPIYLSAKLRSNPTDPYKYGYIIGQLGYNFLMPDSEYSDAMDNTQGGLYYALGLGIVYNNVVFELLSSTNTGRSKIESTNAYVDIEYVKYAFSVGYIF